MIIVFVGQEIEDYFSMLHISHSRYLRRQSFSGLIIHSDCCYCLEDTSMRMKEVMVFIMLAWWWTRRERRI